jgi:glycosyltransferase involved in cell wall biosynthesis
MKKVLIITYYWPPSGGAGVQRWLKFVKYMRDFGWEPVVFIPEDPEYPSIDESLLKDIPENLETIKIKFWEPYTLYKIFTGKKRESRVQAGFIAEEKTKSKALEKFSIWFRGNFFIPDARRFWIGPSVKKLSSYLKKNKVDVMVSTGPPHSAHMIALKLKKKFNLPWVADFRDPWTNIDFYKDLMLTTIADKIHHKMERTVLEKAVISGGMEHDFKQIVNRKYHVLPNGYDPDDVHVSVSEETPKTCDKFILSHIGSLNKDRNPLNLWQALKELTNEDQRFAQQLEIRNVGKIDYTAIETMKSFGLDQYLNKVDYLPHEKVIEQQQNASMLLLLVNRTPNAKLIVTGKIFEYLVSGRPILCIGPEDGDAAAILKETGCGKTFDFEEVEKLKEHILKSFSLFKKNKLTPSCKNIEHYNRKNLTKKLCSIFQEISV